LDHSFNAANRAAFFVRFAANNQRQSKMKSSKDIQSAILDRQDSIEAIEKLAAKEERDFTADEKKAVDAWYGNGDEPGEFEAMSVELKAAQNREQIKREIAASRMAEKSDDLKAEQHGQVKVPARARNFKNLKAFGKVFADRSEAEEQAYVAGQFFAASIGNTHSQDWLSSHRPDIFNAMSEGTNSAGGYAVPDPVEAVMITIAEENGVLRRYARPTTMSSDTHSVPLRTAGLTVYYPGENTAITASDLTIDRALLTAKKYATITEVSSELNEDSLVSMADEIALNVGLAFALAEDTNGFNGDGTSTYASVTGLNSALDANSTQDAASGNVSWATLDLADFEATAALLPRFSGASPAWFIHSAGYFNAMVRLMNASGGTPGSEVASGYNAMFLGYPVVWTQVMPSAPSTSTIAAYFGDLSQSVYMGTRRGISVASDMGGKYFEKDQVAIKGTERVAITVNNQDGSAAGPVVALKTAAS
jgi:HK97 family phage major capsid protein